MYVDTTQAASGAAGAAAAGAAQQEILAFELGDEEYGIDILRVQEIRGFEPVTRIANAPAHMLGVVNLRGTIVPIVDMRIKFRLERVDYNQFTVVIILSLAGRVVGMLVDGVSDVTTLDASQIKAAPGFSNALDVQFITGLGTVDERMLILLDIERLMTSPEMGLFDHAA
jgi:purine-binding chemotaxis protein CheW